MRFLACLLSVLVLSCTSEKKEVLHVYSGLDAKEVKSHMDAFEKATDIEIKWVRMSAGEILARLEAEKKNPQVSVWFGTPSPEFMIATKKGLLASYKPKMDFQLDSKYHDPNWNWTGIYFGAIGFASNEKILKEKGLTPPTSWADLVKEEYKGLVSMAYPYTSGTAYTVVSAILQGFGGDSGWSYLEKLNKQVHHYNKSGSAAVTQAGIGEIGIGIAFSQDILKKGVDAGYPIKLTFPKEGTSYEVGGMALVKGAPEPELAKKFMDFFISKQGQSLFKGFFRVPLHPEAPVFDSKMQAANLNLMPFDAMKAANDQETIIGKWKKLTGR